MTTGTPRVNDAHNSAFKPGPRVQVVNDPRCGIRPQANRRVIDGSDAGFGTFPWQVAVVGLVVVVVVT